MIKKNLFIVSECNLFLVIFFQVCVTCSSHCGSLFNGGATLLKYGFEMLDSKVDSETDVQLSTKFFSCAYNGLLSFRICGITSK